LDTESVGRYCAAVDAVSAAYTGGPGTRVPPLAAMAFALREVLQQVELPAGALHSGQELETYRALPLGSTLLCDAVVSQRSLRGGWIFLSIDFEAVLEGESRPALTARTSVMVPQRT
jgi:hypothetical protein